MKYNTGETNHRTTWRHLLASGVTMLIFLPLIGCGVATVGGEELDGTDGTGTRSTSINGEVSYGKVLFGSGCTTAERAKISQVLARVMELLYTKPQQMDSCMRDAIFSPEYGFSPEWLMYRMRDDKPTRMECVNSSKHKCGGSTNWLACAPIGTSSEKFSWDKNFVKTGSVNSMAGVFLHEVSHNKGTNHRSGLEYAYSIPNQLYRCAVHSNPAGPRRSSLPGQTELAMAGSSGGQPFELGCHEGAFMWGVKAGTGNYWNTTVVKQMRAYCKPVTGGYYSSAFAGSTTGITGTGKTMCPSGTMMVGVYGRAGLIIDSLGIICEKPSGEGTMHLMHVAGGKGGKLFQRRCPLGMAVNRIYGRSASVIDQVRISCQKITDQRGPFNKLSLAGSMNGYHEDRRCSGNGAFVGLYGRSAVELDRLGGICKPILHTSGGALKVSGSHAHITPAAGGTGGEHFKDQCPAGQALIGVYFSSAERINRVRGICGKVNKWQPGVSFSWSADRKLLSSHGGNAGVASSRYCPRGQFVAGMQTWSDRSKYGSDTLHGFRLICRDL